MTILRFFSRRFAGQKGVAQYIQNAEREKQPTKTILLGKTVLWNWRNNFPNKQKLKEFTNTRTALLEILKELLQNEIKGGYLVTGKHIKGKSQW